MYKIEILQYWSLSATYEDDDIEEVLRWYNSNWRYCYELDGCVFYLYKDGVELSFDEEYELGFH